jgi:hypothetical protein
MSCPRRRGGKNKEEENMSARPNKALALGLAAALVGAAGCTGSYYDVVDPCWPARYDCKARGEVIEPLQAQAANGLALEQTLYNHYFKEGGDELLPGGKALLVRVARRRPAPETAVFVQAANDESVLMNKNLEEIAAQRKDLNEKRVKAVADFLKAIRPDVAFTVAVHDPSRVGIDGHEAYTAVRDMHSSAVGNMPLQGAGGVAGGGGGGGAQVGGGGGATGGAMGGGR